MLSSRSATPGSTANSSSMDLTYTPEQDAFRAEVRAWLRAHVPGEPLPSFDTKDGFEAHRRWERELNAGGYAMVPWPVEYGGRGANLLEWLIFEEEYYGAGAPKRVNQNGIFLLGPTIMEYGTPEQKARFLPRMAASDEIWAQGWSEPNAGSDMANIQSSAIRDGDHYVINGQKTWASRGAFADWLFGMFRTDPESERHKGLTFILVPLNLPGVTVRPIDQLDGLPGFAEVFLDDVRVPVENRLGAEGAGWSVAMATAGFERGLMLRSPARFQETARRLVELYRAHRASADPSIADVVVDCWSQTEAYALETYRTVSRLLGGAKIGPEASLNKIFWSELDLRMHETALRILEERGQLLPESPGAGDVGTWLDGYLFALSGPIYAGTNEIQRNIIAERILGMPR
jgi:alkylation response protein AidB-like acyl-CoA dehydrogenase